MSFPLPAANQCRSNAEVQPRPGVSRRDASSCAEFALPEEPKKAAVRDGNAAGEVSGTIVDFHRMSSRQLLQWINTEIAEGRMSLDESTRYVTMTISGMPVNGDSEAWRDEPRDYFADLTGGIAYARSKGDEVEARRLAAMIERLLASQARH